MSRGVNRIFVLGTNGRGLRRLTSGNAFELSPAWSPDGSRIVYWSTAGGGQDVYTSRLSGGTPVRVTRAPKNSGDQDPAWRP